MKKTALYEEHLKLRAKMVPFAGFEMPIQYESAKDEVLAVRNEVGVFDVSHMGEFFVEGKDAVRFVDYLITNDFKNSPVGKAVYSPLCNDEAKILDDLIAYKLSEQKVLICVNASNLEKDWKWIDDHKDGFDVNLIDASNEYSLLALQGPKAAQTLNEFYPQADNLDYYCVVEADEDTIIARTGYTGEDGFEIFTTHANATKLWKSFLKSGVVPAGLAARDILRLEVAYPLYGNDLTDKITPLDCGLKWTVKLEKESFVGKEALSNYAPEYQLVKLSIEKGIPRSHAKVENSEGREIGIVTSGGHSFILNKGIALALIKKDSFPKDEKFIINIRNKPYSAMRHKKAFYQGSHK